MSDPVTVRDILILGLVIIVRDGIPWLMKAAFPAWWKATMEKNKATVTATRYNCIANSVIQTNGGGATYLPGGTAGSVASGGQYL